MLGMVVSLTVATSIPTTPRPTHTGIGDPRPSYMQSFTMSLVYRDFPYCIPTTMMEGLQSNTSTYADNNAKITSPLNQYVASESSISNPSRTTQPRWSWFVLPNTSSLTMNSMVYIR